MTLPYRPSAVIFDMDGLLFETEALWQEALLSAAAEGGHEVADELFSKSIGVPGPVPTAACNRHLIVSNDR